MRFRVSFIVPAVAMALLLACQGSAQAGFLAASPSPWPGMEESSMTSPFDDGAGAGSSTEQDSSATADSPVVVRDAVLPVPVGSFAPGGMSSSTPEVNGQSVPVLAVVPAVTATDVPMVAWVGAEGSASLPAPLSTGILRPPRSVVSG